MNILNPASSFSSTQLLDRVEFLKRAAKHFDGRAEDSFTAARALETLRLKEYNETPIGEASIFTEFDSLAQSMGFQTGGTFGGLTKVFGITQDDAHKIGCACNGEVVMGGEVAKRLRERIAYLTS